MSLIPAALANLPLTPSAVDRDADLRERSELFAELAADHSTRLLVLWRGRMLLDGDNLRLFPADSPTGESTLAYLGKTISDAASLPAGTRVVLVVATDEVATALEPDDEKWITFRSAAPLLSEPFSSLGIEAVALSNWHLSSGFCPRCGSATESESAGWARRCTQCNNQIFPRTDPAIIVLVLDDDDRLLLGSNILWPEGRYSLLAGFVEAGESLEQAVVREIHEESGLHVDTPQYLGSQAWPFPRSIMLGFSARVAPEQNPAGIQPDGLEIVDLRWLSRDDLRAEAGTLLLPGSTSIARALIEHWLAADGGPSLDEAARAATTGPTPEPARPQTDQITDADSGTETQTTDPAETSGAGTAR
ncbi:NAD(+) diphosphatase [Mycetocola zhadangensis]|uniref:NAD(+) diphosphatase n=1 Tax=Mycetocola zhadangensis TaxID=1164595 RepID=A0A3L7J4V4_9MICO|nr:NAD(+) diphosphatase [Mycetocola zhadangensis]RLQ85738.1 NAD(+) diphosphatase [Mycetocola zhadangensis]GGE85345.1 NADH pyrophosphatase [Mycetocola zhadangensis]